MAGPIDAKVIFPYPRFSFLAVYFSHIYVHAMCLVFSLYHMWFKFQKSAALFLVDSSLTSVVQLVHGYWVLVRSWGVVSRSWDWVLHGQRWRLHKGTGFWIVVGLAPPFGSPIWPVEDYCGLLTLCKEASLPIFPIHESAPQQDRSGPVRLRCAWSPERPKPNIQQVTIIFTTTVVIIISITIIVKFAAVIDG